MTNLSCICSWGFFKTLITTGLRAKNYFFLNLAPNITFLRDEFSHPIGEWQTEFYLFLKFLRILINTGLRANFFIFFNLAPNITFFRVYFSYPIGI